MTAPPLVLVLNAGSSSLKYQVVEPLSGRAVLKGVIERVDPGQAEATAARVLDQLASSGLHSADLAGVGHRVVHGGPEFTTPAVIDDDVLTRIDSLSRLAPLHNPPAVAGIRAAVRALPELTQVAVFDTAFFSDLPDAAAAYALDRRLTARLEIRRYGAHGTSHAYVAGEAARFLGRDTGDLDQIVLHLGNGASAAAIRGGVPVDTSMGLTPLEGLVMGTRGGDLDPGVLLYLLRHGDLDLDGLEDLLHHRSGLVGLSGHHDFREVIGAMDAGGVEARAAYDIYCHRLRKYVGAYLAVLGGADVVTFTAGVGENVARLRGGVLSGLERLGIRIDPERNESLY
ncbi:acetate/propionate family kinase [Nocardioides sp.]|uniref:acetate/propionate family kinase n=1 Tax=Nocardioides sp. TaxID=35761 RepID=UPI0031FE4B11|nr:acetate kinase [Nocardioides sp.]